MSIKRPAVAQAKPPHKPAVCCVCGAWPATRLDGLLRRYCEDCWEGAGL